MRKPQWKAVKARLCVVGQRARALREGYASSAAPGLVIHVATDTPFRWTVTHRSSGRAVLHRCVDRGHAERVAIQLARTINFRRPYAEIVADDHARAFADALDREIQEVVA